MSDDPYQSPAADHPPPGREPWTIKFWQLLLFLLVASVPLVWLVMSVRFDESPRRTRDDGSHHDSQEEFSPPTSKSKTSIQ